MIKIVYLSTFYPLRGGIAQFNALIYPELEKKNSIQALTFKRQYPSFLFPGKTQYVDNTDKADVINSKEILDTVNPISYIKTANEIKQHKPDLILTKYWMTFFAPSLGYVLGKQKNSIRISILDNVIPHEKRFFDSIFNNYFLNKNDGFIVMSDKVLKDLLSIKPNAKYLRINHPVYDHFGEKIQTDKAKEKLNLDKNKKTLLFFGIIRDYKGLDLLIKSMNELDESYQLIIAGEVYGSFKKYQELIDLHNLSDRISLNNHYISDDDVGLFFSAADVCILPYKSATQSGITSIANHFLLPIIATNVGGLKETIQHNETGLIVERPSADLIAQSIKLYFAKQLKDKFSQNIIKYNQENSWRNFSSRLLSFYQDLKNPTNKN